MIVRKSRAEIEKMRLAGQVVADVHKMLQDIVVPGVTTAELDKKAEALIRSRGADPTFKGYRVGREVFPATLCVSVNEEIVHGIPGSRVLEEGDLLSVDCGATLSGYVGDSAASTAILGGLLALSLVAVVFSGARAYDWRKRSSRGYLRQDEEGEESKATELAVVGRQQQREVEV